MKINKNIPHCHDITEILLKVALNTVILTHTVGTVPKPNAKIEEGDKIDTTVTNTQNITAHFPG
jgi:hypothetical protein